MLEEIIKKTVQETAEAEKERQYHENAANTYTQDIVRRADGLAAEIVYKRLCEEIAKRIAAEGKQDLTGDMGLASNLYILHIDKWTAKQFIQNSILADAGLTTYCFDEKKLHPDGSIEICYPLYSCDETSSHFGHTIYGNTKYTITLTLGKRWYQFWEALQQLAEKDHLSIEAFCRIKKREEIIFDPASNFTKRIDKTIDSVEQDLPIRPEPYQVEWSTEFKRSTHDVQSFLMNNRIRTKRFLSLMIKYQYHVGD